MEIGENLRVMKLVSGDTIVASLDMKNSSIDSVRIHNPIQFTMMYSGESEGTMVAQSWLETDETMFNLNVDHIVAAALPAQTLKDYYIKNLKSIQEMIQENVSVEDYIEEIDHRFTKLDKNKLH